MWVGPNLENWAISGLMDLIVLGLLILGLGLSLVHVGSRVKCSFYPKPGLWIIVWNPIANWVLFWY